jgi:hypothetical protein
MVNPSPSGGGKYPPADGCGRGVINYRMNDFIFSGPGTGNRRPLRVKRGESGKNLAHRRVEQAVRGIPQTG